MEDSLHPFGAETGVCVENVDRFAEEDVANVGKSSEESRESSVNVRWREWLHRNVIDLQAQREVAYS